MSLEEDIHRVLTDPRWLDKCICNQLDPGVWFVTAGKTLNPVALDVARRCPARRDEVIHAYARNIRPGYFGGLSPGQRAQMSLVEALEYIKHDVPEDVDAATVST